LPSPTALRRAHCSSRIGIAGVRRMSRRMVRRCVHPPAEHVSRWERILRGLV